MEKYKYKAITPLIESEVELWKVARLGYFLPTIQEKYPNFDLYNLLIIMFLQHFHYADANFIYSNQVTGSHKLHYLKIMLNKLSKTNLVDKVDLALNKELSKLYPEEVYQLTPTGRNLTNKIQFHLNGMGDFLNFHL